MFSCFLMFILSTQMGLCFYVCAGEWLARAWTLSSSACLEPRLDVPRAMPQNISKCKGCHEMPTLSTTTIINYLQHSSPASLFVTQSCCQHACVCDTALCTAEVFQGPQFSFGSRRGFTLHPLQSLEHILSEPVSSWLFNDQVTIKWAFLGDLGASASSAWLWWVRTPPLSARTSVTAGKYCFG